MNLKIVSFYSFETPILQEFEKSHYVKVFCGDKNGISPDFFRKMDFSDDVGDNISYLNKYINEMTGIYWTYKNYNRLGNPDFIGTAHYRRYLDVKPEDVCGNKIFCETKTQPYSIFNTYQIYHVRDDFYTFNRNFSHHYQKYAVDLNDYLNQDRQAIRNMFVMSRENFMEYGEFIGKCLGVLLKMKDQMDLDSRDKYQMRGMGFILERMTGFWIFMKERHNECQAVQTKIISMEEINSPYQRT